MKIALFNGMSPFIRGGAEILVDDLYDELKKRGHSVTLFRIPFPNNYEMPLMQTMLAAKLFDFSEYDRVIAFKFPAFYAVHPGKVLWIFHQFRQVYELYNKEYGLSDKYESHIALRQLISVSDKNSFENAKHIYTIAAEVTERMKKYNGVDSVKINPPLKDFEKYSCKAYGDYLFYPSRVTDLKRQLLLVSAMKHTKTNVKLVIAGICENDKYLSQIKSQISENALENRVVFENRWISEQEKLDYLANCLACAFIPYKEDYGFITLEGFYSSKAVLTCVDSGGPLEFVEDGKTGYITQPTPQALAEAMDKLYADRKNAEKMGQAARKEIIDRNITWDETVRRLLL